MRLAEPRLGEQVRVRDRVVTFSAWPIGQGSRREKLQSTLFASDPWNLIQYCVDEIANDTAKVQARAFLRQSKDFFQASISASADAAKPLLLYYSFLNLAKCFVVKRRNSPLTARINHGLTERLPVTAGAINGEVGYAPNNNAGAFQLFADALSFVLPVGPLVNGQVNIRSTDILSQILVGHRVLCQAEGYNERFVSIEKMEYLQDSNIKSVWLSAILQRQDLTRLGYTGGDVAASLGRTGNGFRNVTWLPAQNSERMVQFEQRTLFTYNQRPSEVLNEVSASTSTLIWRVVTTFPPYRKYYVYVPTASQVVLHQLLSIYASMYYFGSITRYKPEGFSDILSSKIGPFVYEFFSSQPYQFLYLISSEFAKQEIARAAVT
jgi:hypothetical protein